MLIDQIISTVYLLLLFPAFFKNLYSIIQNITLSFSRTRESNKNEIHLYSFQYFIRNKNSNQWVELLFILLGISPFVN